MTENISKGLLERFAVVVGKVDPSPLDESGSRIPVGSGLSVHSPGLSTMVLKASGTSLVGTIATSCVVEPRYRGGSVA